MFFPMGRYCITFLILLSVFSKGAVFIDNWVDLEGDQSDMISYADAATGVLGSLTVTSTSAFLPDAGIELNSVNSNDQLAVNLVGDGSDVPDAVDGKVSAEGMDFLFTTAVTLTALDFAQINWDSELAYETVEVRVNGVLTYTLFSDNADNVSPTFLGATGGRLSGGTDDFDFSAAPIMLSSSDTLNFSWGGSDGVSQNGWVLDSMTFSAVPEPSACFLLFLSGALVMRRVR